MVSRIFASSLLLFLVLSFTSIAAAEQGDHVLSFAMTGEFPTGQLELAPDVTLECGETVGFWMSYEYLALDWLGLEPGLHIADYDLEYGNPFFLIPDSDIGDIAMLDMFANLNFYVVRGSRIRLGIGPRFGFIWWGNVANSEDFLEEVGAEPDQDIPVLNDFAFGGNLSFDVQLDGDSKWDLNLGLTYYRTQLQWGDTAMADEVDSVGVHPLIISFGFAHRF